MTISYRHATPADHAFVNSNWLEGHKRSGRDPFAFEPGWWDFHWGCVDRLRSRPGVDTVIACSASDGTILHGFICADVTGSTPIVFWLYVKEASRRGKALGMPVGIGRGLFAALRIDPERPFVYAFKTPVMSELRRKIPLARKDVTVARCRP